MCVSRENTTDEELALIETLGKSMGENSSLGNFLQSVAEVIRAGGGLCIGIPVPPEPPSPPGWTLPN